MPIQSVRNPTYYAISQVSHAAHTTHGLVYNAVYSTTVFVTRDASAMCHRE
jgi:hypothetical protein